jgi:leucyl aminopeptidase
MAARRPKSPVGVLRNVVATTDPGDAAVAVVVAAAPNLDEALADMVTAGGPDVRTIFQRLAAEHKGASVLDVATDQGQWERVVWVPLIDSESARNAGALLAASVAGDAYVWAAPPADSAQEFLLGWLLGGYTFTMRSQQQEVGGSLGIGVDPAVVSAAHARANAIAVARDLANTPSNIKNPQWFVDRVRTLVDGTGIEMSVFDEKRLRQDGFGGLLAVGEGSAQPPRLLLLTLPGATASSATVALVGKGITFDSGGLSIKPADGMVTMKTDMSGAAAVVGAMLAMSGEARPEATVVGVIPLAENMPSGSAYRPGDVVRHYGGRTTEVSNTDAEGRMVLADALVFAQEHFHPDVIVDIATLTGAAKLGLSSAYAALYANDDALAVELLDASERSQEPIWRMPLQPEYERFVDSVIADTTQSSTDPQARAGSITAALFLQRFVDDGVPWAHLDIAGPARAERTKGAVTAGGTGFGVGLLADWVQAQYG